MIGETQHTQLPLFDRRMMSRQGGRAVYVDKPRDSEHDSPLTVYLEQKESWYEKVMGMGRCFPRSFPQTIVDYMVENGKVLRLPHPVELGRDEAIFFSKDNEFYIAQRRLRKNDPKKRFPFRDVEAQCL